MNDRDFMQDLFTDKIQRGWNK